MRLKRTFFCIFSIVLVTFFLTPALLTAFEPPSSSVVVPEIVWAPASGGGTWITQLQITDFSGGSEIRAYFVYGASWRFIPHLWTGVSQYKSVLFTNILSTLQSLDSGFTYYGRAGSLVLLSQDENHKIHALARIYNGNYGKIFPGLKMTSYNCAFIGRPMVIQDLRFSSTFRTTVGCFSVMGGTMQVQFTLVDANGNAIGTPFTKTFWDWHFMTFNPFKEAGITTGTYENVWLYINVTYHSPDEPATGLFCFASTVNNYTNDPSPHIAVLFQ